MARTMLDEHRTLRRYWAEAVNTACHVSNRILLRAFKRKTCYELMHGRAPKVSVTPDFPKETKCKPICMPGSSFMHIVTYKCIQK
jgi:hypothetical protein